MIKTRKFSKFQRFLVFLVLLEMFMYFIQFSSFFMFYSYTLVKAQLYSKKLENTRVITNIQVWYQTQLKKIFWVLSFISKLKLDSTQPKIVHHWIFPFDYIHPTSFHLYAAISNNLFSFVCFHVWPSDFCNLFKVRHVMGGLII